MQMNTQSPNGEFHAGVFDCFSNCGTCVLAWFCPCVVYGQNQAALKNGDGWVVDSALYLAAACCGCNSCLGAVGRDKIRESRGIEGQFITDCLLHTCCVPCTLTQERVELMQAGKI
ncbi:hypothetical protein BC833DRAFT_576406 [Globomyces pollinis-pini]|nr:hypothetical protein BC833DRAFT_576406 [Globomyces pollinis-pini]